MTSTLKRLLSLTLTGALAVSLTACGGSSSGLSDNTVVMTISGNDVTMDEYRSFASYAKGIIDQGAFYQGQKPEEIWKDPEAANQLISMTDAMLVENQAIRDQCEKLGIEISKDDEASLKQEKERMIQTVGGQAPFEKWLAQNGMTEDSFNTISRLGMMQMKLSAHYFGKGGELATDDAAIRKTFDSDYLKSKHILIKSIDDSNAPLTGEALEKQKAKLAEVQQKLAAPDADFDALMQQYSEDGGLATAPDGYLFKEGDMVPQFYEGTRALAVGQMSEPIQSPFGWHIILRVQPTEEDFLSVYESIAQDYSGKTFDMLISEWTSALKTEKTEAHEKITPAELGI